jgi:monothiol glutaredoxin
MSTNEILSRIENQIANHMVLLYLKGTPDLPMCGYSSRVVQILNELNTEYAFVNILSEPEIRAALPGYANWPTFPQLYIQGELMGGCDIVSDLHEKGELKSLLSAASALVSATPQVIMASE